MSVSTWLDRITSETNIWFHAVKMEENGELLEAVVLYLEDAAERLKENSLVSAALSCSCAAHCLLRTDNHADARQLYQEAGKIYRENAYFAMERSVREALWSLRKAYECFQLVQDSEGIRGVREVYTLLSRRVNPFSGYDDALPTLETLRASRPSESEPQVQLAIPPKKLKKIKGAVEAFVQLRRSSQERTPTVPTEDRDNAEGPEVGKKSTVSQLG